MSDPIADVLYGNVPAYQHQHPWPAGVNRVWHEEPVSVEFYRDAPTKPGRRSNYVEPDPIDAAAWLAAMRAEGKLVDDQDLVDKVAAESRDLRGEFA